MGKGIRHFLYAVASLATALVLPASLWAQVHVVGGLSRRMELTPGAETQGRVIVRNPTDQPQTARVYLTDYQAAADGTTRYGDPAKASRSNAAWIHLVPQQQEISAEGTASFHYVVRVPEDPSLVGSYWSMLMVEPVAVETLSPPTLERGRARVGVRTLTRIGIHMVTHIQKTGLRDLRFADRQLEQKDGRTFLRLDLENTGERYLNLSLWVDLFDSQGVSIGRFDAGRRGLYPGNSARLLVEMTGLPPGLYQAMVVADNSDEHVFGARYELEIPK